MEVATDASLDHSEGNSHFPPSKRVKLEHDVDGESRLLFPAEKREKKRGSRIKLSKTTIEERALKLLRDERISAVEPSQVLCKMCGHWVKLFKHTDFSPANWRVHAEKCEARSGWSMRPRSPLTIRIPARPNPNTSTNSQTTPNSVNTSSSAAAAHESVKTSETSLESVSAPVNNSNTLFAEYPPMPETSEEERKRHLESDPRVEICQPHYVLCLQCKKWVFLHPAREYEISTWLQHIEKCDKQFRSLRKDTSDGAGDETMVDAETTLRDTDNGAADLSKDVEVHIIDDDDDEDDDDDDDDDILDVSKRSMGSISAPVKSETGEDPEVLFAAFQAEGENIYTGRRRKGRTAEERRKVLEDDPRAGQVNPHDVYCKMCNKWIKLYRDIPYVESNWTRHAERCEVRQAAKMHRQTGSKSTPVSTPQTNATPSSSKRTIPTPLSSLKQPEGSMHTSISAPVASSSTPSDSPAITAEESISTGPAPVREGKNAEGRKAELEADQRIKAVEAHQVHCGICGNWVKLQPYREYDTWNWRKHITLCEQRQARAEAANQMSVKLEEKEAGPSKFHHVSGIYPYSTAPRRITLPKVKDASTAEDRRQELIRDGRCEAIEPHHVICRNCGREIGLHTKKDYSLTNWIRHIRCCLKSTDKKSPVKTPILTPLSVLGLNRPATASPTSPSKQLSSVGEPLESAIDLTQDEDDNIPDQVPPKEVAKRNAEERRLKLLADPRVEAVQPNCVQCKLCHRWLKLTETTDYAPYNWYKHVERCAVRTAYKSSDNATSTVLTREELPPNKHVEKVNDRAPDIRSHKFDAPVLISPNEDKAEEKELEDDGQSDDDPSSLAKWSSKKRHSTEERLARLQADKRIKTIEKHRAQCGICDKWVKLQNKTEYDPHNWFAHIKKCEIRAKVPSASAPLPTIQPIIQRSTTPTPPEETPSANDSDSVSCAIGKVGNVTIDRRTLLESDECISQVEPHRVLCTICQQWIKLREEKDYVPYNWFKHKAKCERKHGLSHEQPPIQDHYVEAEVKEVLEAASSSAIKPVVKDRDIITISSSNRKISTEDREAELRADPRTAGVEPGRVLCKICNSWIKLNTATGFLPGNWLRHAARCQRKNQWQSSTPLTIPAPELSTVEFIDLDAEQLSGTTFGSIELAHIINGFEPTISSQDFGKAPEVKEVKSLKQEPSWTLRARTNTPTPAVAVVPVPTPIEPKVSEVTGKRMHRTEESRKEDLERDPRTKIVHPEKILCAMCDRWIQMRKDVSYSPQNWLKHAGICEARTGWKLNYSKPESEPSTVKDTKSGPSNHPSHPPSRDQSEEPMPYNARVAKERDSLKTSKRSFLYADPIPTSCRPVNWEQEVIYSDSDNDDDEDLAPGPIPAHMTIPPVPTDVQTNTPSISSQSLSATDDPATALSQSGKGKGKKPVNVVKSYIVQAPYTPSPLPVWRPVGPAGNGQRMVIPQIKPPVPYPYATPYGAGITQVTGILPHLLPPTMTMYTHPHAHSLPSPFQKTTPPVPPSAIGKAVSPPAYLPPPVLSTLPTPPPSTSTSSTAQISTLPNGVLRLAPSPPPVPVSNVNATESVGKEVPQRSETHQKGVEARESLSVQSQSSYLVPPLTKLNVPLIAPQPAPAIAPLQPSLPNTLTPTSTLATHISPYTSTDQAHNTSEYKAVQFVPQPQIRRSPGPVGPVGPGVLQLAPTNLGPTGLRMPLPPSSTYASDSSSQMKDHETSIPKTTPEQLTIHVGLDSTSIGNVNTAQQHQVADSVNSSANVDYGTPMDLDPIRDTHVAATHS